MSVVGTKKRRSGGQTAAHRKAEPRKYEAVQTTGRRPYLATEARCRGVPFTESRDEGV